jgi:hypothetical protein
MEKVLFKEEQRFKQWWIWLILVVTLLALIVPLINAITEEQASLSSSGNARFIVYGVLAVLFLVPAITVILFIKLKTKITEKCIYVAYFPFVRQWKEISLSEIKKYEIRKYRPMLEYGGYGMKKRRKAGQAFSISGNMGLQLYLKNGKKLLIGTHKKQAMEYAMAKLIGASEQDVSKDKFEQGTESIVRRKVKKILIIVLIEIIAGIIIFSLIQIFK